MVDVEHIQLYDNIAAGNLEGARSVLAGHIANVKNHAVSSIERMNREKNKNPILTAQATQTRWDSSPCTRPEFV